MEQHKNAFSRRKFLVSSSAFLAAAALPKISFAQQAAFPEGFLFGAASASAQVESRVGRGRSNWDIFADQSGKILDGSTNALNTEFESRYSEELTLLANAGVKGFRFSLSWPRIQPEGPGAPSMAGLDTYDRILDEILRLGMQPLPTIIHFEMPAWAGDFRDRDITKRMADYAEIVTRAFGDRMNSWLMLNEPSTVSTTGYGSGRVAPGYSSMEAVGEAIHHQNLGQGLMMQAARANLPGTAKLSTTLNLQPVRTKGETDADREAVRKMDAYWNGAYLDPLFGKEYPADVLPLVADLIHPDDMSIIAGKPDFLGANYYFRFYVKAEEGTPFGFVQDTPPDNLERTQYFQIEPDGLVEILLRIHNDYGAPEIYLTEFGFALDDAGPVNGVVEDPKRISYMHSYLQAMQESISKGVKLKGAMYWASTDNWEWSQGFSKHFGLIQVDRANQARYPKRSLEYWGNCSKTNSIVSI